MRLTEHANKLETNTQTVSQNFGIGDASVVIEILRNRLYEHKIRTLVQEYMCNGRDAQREIKSRKRLIVTVPNELNPVFKVRDFGPGITPERMSGVFVLYGASTKRNTNGQTGGFGIGAKSAWSYTDSFTIISVTDGVKRTYVAHTGVNNQGRLDLLSEVATDDENGTEIQVAVKPHDCREFRESVFRACYFWSKSERPDFRGVTAIDIPDHIEGLRIGNVLEVSTKQLPYFLNLDWGDKCALVIDGIPYPVGRKLVNQITNLSNLVNRVKTAVILHIGNGTVEVSASREAIADSEFTRNNLNKLCLKASDELKEYVRESFKAAKSNADWIKTYHEFDKTVNVDDYSNRGDYKIERSSINSLLFGKIRLEQIQSKHRRGKTSLERDNGRFILLDQLASVFYIDTDESTVMQGKRLREYLETHQRTGAVVISRLTMATMDREGKPIIPTVSETDSLKALKQIIKDLGAKPLSTLPITPVVREPKAKRDRTKEMFTIHDCSHTGSKSPNTTTLEQVQSHGHNYLYIKYSDYEKFESEFRDMFEFLSKQGLRLCALTDKSIEMVDGSILFSRYEDWRRDFKPSSKLVNGVKFLKAKNKQSMKVLAKADIRIKDKHVSKMLSEYGTIVEVVGIPEMIVKMISKELTDFISDDENLTSILRDKYPLLNVCASDWSDYKIKKENANELVFYINSK